MNPRTPYNQMPISYVFKATRQKIFRQAHCEECGWPIGEVTDKVVTIYDGNTTIEKLVPDNIGVVEVHCKRHECKQYIRFEFAR